ncbi:MAG: family 20 glycosylhydrolase [Clostridia bacterium]|nr:family 20 glycosylhydrolase [Clostridia bacterium]
MFFSEAKKKSDSTESYHISGSVRYMATDPEFKAVGKFFSYFTESILGLKGESVTKDAHITFEKAALSAEEYELVVGDTGVFVKAADKRGAIYALSTLLSLAERDIKGIFFPLTSISDKPYAEIRGAHFYMPARDKIEEFKRIIDCMAFMKMNTVILEVGGGMEYERHPEVNRGWEKFCKIMNNMPGIDGTRSFQGADMYWKDSLHTELCGGSYLTKAEVRDIVEYCRERGMDVIPEVQALSHAYYLTTAHPEIAELENDLFPDTYCPNNEESYKLYFEIADEVLKVFEPKTVSIGHDEIRVMGWCDKCKDIPAHELIGRDICRLHDFYATRGVRIAMWAESAQTFISSKGSRVGVDDYERVDAFGRYYKLPATYKSIEILPNDILMLDWHHSAGPKSEECFDKRGFDVIYGNFHGSLFGEFDIRSRRGCMRGAEVSTWCPPTEEILASDGILFEFMFSSQILWANDYDNSKYDQVIDSVRALAPYLRAINRGKPSRFASTSALTPVYVGNGDHPCGTIDLAGASIPDEKLRSLLSPLGTLNGVSTDEGIMVIKGEFKADALLFIHNCKKEVAFTPSYYFRDPKQRGLLSYAIRYEDGDFECVNVYYGTEVGASCVDYSRKRSGEEQALEIDMEIKEGDAPTLPCYYTQAHPWIESLTYNTTPIIHNDTAVFAYEWQNPHPDKKIVMIRPYTFRKDYTALCSADRSQAVVLFGIFAPN